MVLGLRLVKLCFTGGLYSHGLGFVLLDDICLDECPEQIVLVSDGINQCSLLVVVGLHLYVIDHCFQCNVIPSVPALLLNMYEMNVEQPVGR